MKIKAINAICGEFFPFASYDNVENKIICKSENMVNAIADKIMQLFGTNDCIAYKDNATTWSINLK